MLLPFSSNIPVPLLPSSPPLIVGTFPSPYSPDFRINTGSPLRLFYSVRKSIYTPSLYAAHRTMSSTAGLRSLNINNINPHVKEAKYAVRGELAVRSEEYRAKLAKGDTDLPFDQVISANIGNPQQLDQKPITFFRQVLSLLEYPPLLEKEDVLLNQLGYKSDVIARAKWLLKSVGSVGAYSASAGATGIKDSVARFIEGMLKFIEAMSRFTNSFLFPQNEMVSRPRPKTSIFLEEPHLESTHSYTSSAPNLTPAFLSQSHNTLFTPPPSPYSMHAAFHTTSTKRRTGGQTLRLSKEHMKRLFQRGPMFGLLS